MSNILLYIFLYLLIGFCLALIWGFIELNVSKAIINDDVDIMRFITFLWPVIIILLIVVIPITLVTIVFERIFKTR